MIYIIRISLHLWVSSRPTPCDNPRYCGGMHDERYRNLLEALAEDGVRSSRELVEGIAASRARGGERMPGQLMVEYVHFKVLPLEWIFVNVSGIDRRGGRSGGMGASMRGMSMRGGRGGIGSAQGGGMLSEPTTRMGGMGGRDSGKLEEDTAET